MQQARMGQTRKLSSLDLLWELMMLDCCTSTFQFVLGFVFREKLLHREICWSFFGGCRQVMVDQKYSHKKSTRITVGFHPRSQKDSFC